MQGYVVIVVRGQRCWLRSTVVAWYVLGVSDSATPDIRSIQRAAFRSWLHDLGHRGESLAALIGMEAVVFRHVSAGFQRANFWLIARAETLYGAPEFSPAATDAERAEGYAHAYHRLLGLLGGIASYERAIALQDPRRRRMWERLPSVDAPPCEVK